MRAGRPASAGARRASAPVRPPPGRRAALFAGDGAAWRRRAESLGPGRAGSAAVARATCPFGEAGGLHGKSKSERRSGSLYGSPLRFARGRPPHRSRPSPERHPNRPAQADPAPAPHLVNSGPPLSSSRSCKRAAGLRARHGWPPCRTEPDGRAETLRRGRTKARAPAKCGCPAVSPPHSPSGPRSAPKAGQHPQGPPQRG